MNVWSFGGRVVKDQNTRRETSHVTCLSTTDPICIGLESNPKLGSERPTSNFLSRGAVLYL